MQPIALLSVFALAGSMALAQVVTSIQQTAIQQTAPQGAITMGFNGGPGVRHVGPPVIGMPYSAEQVTERVQTLADGTHIRQSEQTVLMYRDSQGRTRTERSVMGPPGRTSGAKFAQITDVVGGYEYTLDDVNKIAHRVAIQTMPPPRPAPLRSPNGAVGSPAQIMGVIGSGGGGVPLPAQRVAPNGGVSASGGQILRPEMQSEDLGIQSIEGVTARGRRTTQTWPVDSVGNDRPIVAVHENWTSDQLGGMMVLSKNTDPRYGETTTALKNISLSEPDPALFQPPPGYQIADETGQFNIAVPKPVSNTPSR